MINKSKLIVAIYLIVLTQPAIAKREYTAPGTTNTQDGQFGLGTAGSPFAGKWDIETEINSVRAQDDVTTKHETTILYGFTDWFGFQVTIPFYLENKMDNKTSRGIGDISFEGVFNIFRDDIHLFSLTTGLQVPSGSIRKDPPTSTGSFDFVGEIFFSHDSQYWYADAAADWDITSRRNNQKTGNEYMYFLTLGYKIKFKKRSPTTLYFLLALTGDYSEPDEKNRIIDPDSGGNVIFIGPFFSWLRKSILIEATFQVPFTQSLNGKQNKNDFYSLISFEVQF